MSHKTVSTATQQSYKFKFVDVFKSPGSEVSCHHFTPEEEFLSLSSYYYFANKPVCLTEGSVCI